MAKPEYQHGVFYDVYEFIDQVPWYVPESETGKITDLEEFDFTPFLPEGVEISGVRDTVTGWFYRLPPDGSWIGPYDTLKDAKEWVEEDYDIDPDTGEPLFVGAVSLADPNVIAVRRRHQQAAGRDENPRANNPGPTSTELVGKLKF